MFKDGCVVRGTCFTLSITDAFLQSLWRVAFEQWWGLDGEGRESSCGVGEAGGALDAGDFFALF
jgi:hypothetical protein